MKEEFKVEAKEKFRTQGLRIISKLESHGQIMVYRVFEKHILRECKLKVAHKDSEGLEMERDILYRLLIKH